MSPSANTPKVVPITARDNAQLVKARKWSQDASLARRDGVLWLEGEHLLTAAADRGWSPSMALVTQRAWDRADRARQLASLASTVLVLSPALLATVTALDSPSEVAWVLPARPSPALRPDQATVVLDRVQDPGNVGSILRSASAFGFKQVVALKGTASLWSHKVLRAAMGAQFDLAMVDAADVSALDALALPWYGTSSHATQSLSQLTLAHPCVWLVGHEGQGLAADLQARCSQVVRIEQPGGEESLNVAVAAGICLHASVLAAAKPQRA